MAKKTPAKAAKKKERKTAPAADTLRQAQGSTFGRRLKAARDAAGFTQASFGDVVGINKRVIIRYELDQAAPSVHAAARMAKAAGASLDALAGLSASAQDPGIARLLAQFTSLPEQDRASVQRMIAGLVELNAK
ncbi:MAG: helix-turn-helix transcriptional regulator [Flavobacteriales bacterium]|nr:helix-turn-helix transcriptional regulator [Flavobacteriales bacterium]